MFSKIESWLTLGNRYVTASVIYLGLTLILGGSTLLDSPRALANDDEESGCVRYEDQEGEMVPIYGECPEGEQCCEDKECIPASYICCEDGSNGNAETCECCDDCDDEMIKCD